MKPISELFTRSLEDTFNQKVLFKNIKSERADIIRQFLERLNSERGLYAPLSPAYISMMMPKKKYPTNHHLYMFLGNCKEAKNFSKYWWFIVKPKKK